MFQLPAYLPISQDQETPLCMYVSIYLSIHPSTNLCIHNMYIYIIYNISRFFFVHTIYQLPLTIAMSGAWHLEKVVPMHQQLLELLIDRPRRMSWVLVGWTRLNYQLKYLPDDFFNTCAWSLMNSQDTWNICSIAIVIVEISGLRILPTNPSKSMLYGCTIAHGCLLRTLTPIQTKANSHHVRSFLTSGDVSLPSFIYFMVQCHWTLAVPNHPHLRLLLVASRPNKHINMSQFFK